MSIDINQHISTDFALNEFLKSQTSERNSDWQQKQMDPSPDIVDNLIYLVQTVIQPIREALHYPIIISSGYRCPEVNKAIGSSDKSQHIFGEASDTEISDNFLTASVTVAIRTTIQAEFLKMTGICFRPNVSANFYLFVYVALNLAELGIDQLIHEFGTPGRPAWTHISKSKHGARGQILVIDNTGTRELDIKSALMLGA